MDNIISSDLGVFLGAAICTLPMAVVAWGVTRFWTTLIETIGRNPQANKELSAYAWVGFATIEAIALYCLAVAMAMLFK